MSTTWIEVNEVRQFSIQDGPTKIWAAGVAGWFELRPANAYRKVFAQMVEGIGLYYGLYDLHHSNKKAKKLEVPELLDQVLENKRR